ncbi:MAG: hypothetical protein JST54_29510 [Deltaproteobacteria bacterium]|nr:hypothetical protein [Deltaproteobacteria bacterium]
MKIPLGALARLATIGLAIWMWLSCFVWERTANTTLMLGLIMTGVIVATEAMAFADTRVRYGTTVMGALIVLMGLLMGHTSSFLRWHDAAIGVSVMLLSLIPNPELAPDPDTTIPAPR